MAITQYKERDITVKAGTTFTHNCSNNTNIVQIINRDMLGGAIYADTRENVSALFYSARVDKGGHGSIVRPYNIPQIWLVTDAAIDARITIIEMSSQNVDVILNTSQVVQIQGSVAVKEPMQISGATTVTGEVEIKNDLGNPVPVVGSVKITNDIPEAVPIKSSGSNIPVSVQGTPNVAITGTPAVTATITGTPAVTISGTPSVNATLSGTPTTKTEGFKSQKVTAGASGVQTVSASPGRVAMIFVASDVITVTLKDNTADKLPPLLKTDGKFMLPNPIVCATSIKLDFSAAGDAWIIYQDGV